MSTLAPSAPGAKPAPHPRPARHGKCRLVIFINEDEYILKRRKSPTRGARVWQLCKRSGPRTGAAYLVSRSLGFNSCTCPDFVHNKFSCKHIKALVAARVLSGRCPAGETPAFDLDQVARASLSPSPSLRAPGAPGARALPAPARPLPTTVPDEIRSPGARRTAAAILARAALLNGSLPKGGAE